MSLFPPSWLDAYFGTGYVAVASGVTLFPPEKILNFQGPGVSVTDDPTNDQTIILISAGGTGSTTTTTANFTQPAVSSTVTVPVTSTASLAAGLVVFIAGGGYYSIASITDGTHFVATNLGLSVNASPTTVINTGALVIATGPNAGGLVIEGNDTALPVRNTLDFRGFLAADDSANGRTVITNSVGAPLAVSGATTLTTAQTYVEFTAGNYAITFPATPFVGATIELVHVASTLVSSNLSFAGNGHNVIDPANRLAAASASVFPQTDGATYRYRYNGSIWRCVGVC